ncbi:MAG: WS/DGAT domain-containing protein, partial [Solirubrobacterales bacterium]
FSYAGEITVGLMVDAGLVPDPDEIVTDFERELDSLCAT